MEYKVTVLRGDGIGPEIVGEAKKVLKKVAELEGFSLHFQEELFGGAAVDAWRTAPGKDVARLQRK